MEVLFFGITAIVVELSSPFLYFLTKKMVLAFHILLYILLTLTEQCDTIWVRQSKLGLPRQTALGGINMTLAELAVGQHATIQTVGGEGPLRLRFLDMGLIPRTKVSVIKVAPMGDPIEIRIRGYELTLRKEDAAQIEITQD